VGALDLVRREGEVCDDSSVAAMPGERAAGVHRCGVAGEVDAPPVELLVAAREVVEVVVGGQQL
jgi:hypothetical protein